MEGTLIAHINDVFRNNFNAAKIR